MTPFKPFSTRSFHLCVLVAALGMAGCDSSSDSNGGARSGANQADDSAQVGGGFSPDPDCSYDCVDASGNETVCVQACPDSCQTIVMRREVGGNNSIDVTESSSEQCPDNFPDDSSGLQLWWLTCDILYRSSDPEHEGDCDEIFSAEACGVAFDLCLPPE